MRKVFCPYHNQEIYIIEESEILLLGSISASNCVMLKTSDDFLIPFRFTEGYCDLSCPKVIELQGTFSNDS